MSPKPLDFLQRRKAERIYQEGGWGPLLTFPVSRLPNARAEAEPLVFQLRLPVTLELVDVAALAAHASGAPASLAEGTQALQRAAAAANAFLTGALRSVPSDGSVPEVMATLTVALTDLPWPPAAEDITPGDLPTTQNSSADVTTLSDRAVLVHRISMEQFDPAADPTPLLIEQYVIDTRYGPMVMGYSTTRTDMMGSWALELYRDITKTAFIGERPKPY
jgi:hypothetical protein